MHSTAAQILISFFFFTLNIFPISKMIVDLIFFPPEINPYFIGLINKAADAGYKGFVILSGLHNNLRQQTQVRLDHGFLGYETTESTYYSQHKLPLWKKPQRQKEKWF